MVAKLKRKSSEASGNLITKIADETISALRGVRATSSERVALADKDSYTEAEVLGVSLNAGNVGDNIRIVTFGEIKDSFFNFPLNEPIFLGDNGLITDVAPIEIFNKPIGYSLGPGAIFVNIGKTIELC